MDIFDAKNQLDFFNSFAEKYNRVDWFTFGLSKRINRKVIDSIQIPENAIVCDLMCGDGKNIPLLMDRLKCKTLYAVDFSEAMIRQAEKKHACEKVVFLNENSLLLSLPDASIDAVTCTFGIKTMKFCDQQLLLQEIKRVLKPGGVFVIAEISKPLKTIPLAFSYFFFHVILEMESFVFRYKFIRRKFLWKYVETFGSVKAIGDYSSSFFSETKFSSWYGGIVTGINGKKVD